VFVKSLKQERPRLFMRFNIIDVLGIPQQMTQSQT
jgi:hypothetical protein